MGMDENPYVVPQTEVVNPAAAGNEEMDRRAHISTESSIKSVGCLYILGAIVTVFSGVAVFASINASSYGGETSEMVIAALIIVLGILGFCGAIGCFGLKPWSRIAVGICSGVGLLGFPLGTVINAYILYLFFSPKGARVFRPDYKGVIAATPHVKMKTSPVVWVLLIVLLAVLGLAVFAAMKST